MRKEDVYKLWADNGFSKKEASAAWQRVRQYQIGSLYVKHKNIEEVDDKLVIDYLQRKKNIIEPCKNSIDEVHDTDIYRKCIDNRITTNSVYSMCRKTNMSTSDAFEFIKKCKDNNIDIKYVHELNRKANISMSNALSVMLKCINIGTYPKCYISYYNNVVDKDSLLRCKNEDTRVLKLMNHAEHLAKRYEYVKDLVSVLAERNLINDWYNKEDAEIILILRLIRNVYRNDYEIIADTFNKNDIIKCYIPVDKMKTLIVAIKNTKK